MGQVMEKLHGNNNFISRINERIQEPWLSGSQQLVHVDYTYWTLSYILSKAGAAKLIDAEPLSKEPNQCHYFAASIAVRLPIGIRPAPVYV